MFHVFKCSISRNMDIGDERKDTGKRRRIVKHQCCSSSSYIRHSLYVFRLKIIDLDTVSYKMPSNKLMSKVDTQKRFRHDHSLTQKSSSHWRSFFLFLSFFIECVHVSMCQ